MFAMEQGYLSGTVLQKWYFGDLGFDTNASRTVRNILNACSLDWRKVTAPELDDVDPRLVGAAASAVIMVVRSWRESVS